ncbi:conserved hypothetical protein [Ricinus communis]|uniref:Uncharacterized protein n=1 Tax=Ricinus communis TaxID=3988 RepID=B9T1R7_RICCO|nr:conserved hypothetical protein [Ricinus communis]
MQPISTSPFTPTTYFESFRSKLRVHLRNNLMEPSSSCSCKIKKIFEEKLDLDGFKWKNVSKEMKNFYFNEEVFMHVHMIGRDGKTFIDDKSKAVNEEIESR